jgi:hypothetical protein
MPGHSLHSVSPLELCYRRQPVNKSIFSRSLSFKDPEKEMEGLGGKKK